MGYYKLNEDGSLQSANTQIDDTWYNLDILELDESGNYYKYYNQDGTPNIERITELSLVTMIAQGEALVKAHIQSVIDIYNEKHKIRFKDVDSCFKYTSNMTYEHYQFCMDIISFNIDVWEVSRMIQADILDGTLPKPTTEEFIDLLPVYGGTV